MNKILFLLILLLFFLLAYIFYSHYQVSIGKYQWKQCIWDQNISKITYNGKTIVPWGEIELWGRYPYLWGQTRNYGVNRWFFINYNTDKPIYFNDTTDFKKQTGYNIDPEKMVTFQSVRGQWQDISKLRYLQKEFSTTKTE